MAKTPNKTGFQPRNTPAERRAFFEHQRQLRRLEESVSGTGDLPTGGTTNQVLAKQSNVDFDTYWAAPGMSQATADIRYANIVGDTMTGPLVLPADPTTALQAATKQYVDDQVASIDPWPVGSVYVSVLATAPPFPGTWVAIDPGAAIAVDSPAAMTLYYWRRTA